MPWSIFSDGGGAGAARTWAKDLLSRIGAPDTSGNEQFVFDWEVSEGGGGKYNPLNQGPVPGHPELTTTGSQYGGGAADFASWNAGLQGAADYLGMSNFRAIGDDLRANQPAAARSALIASPWAASHYNGGSGFSNAALPGQASALPGVSGTPTAGAQTTPTTVQDAQTTSFIPPWVSEGILGGIFGGLTGNPNPGIALGQGVSDPFGIGALTTAFKVAVIAGPILIAGAALVVLGLVKATNAKEHAENAAGTAAKVGEVAALA